MKWKKKSFRNFRSYIKCECRIGSTLVGVESPSPLCVPFDLSSAEFLIHVSNPDRSPPINTGVSVFKDKTLMYL